MEDGIPSRTKKIVAREEKKRSIINCSSERFRIRLEGVKKARKAKSLIGRLCTTVN